ncbi:MAG: hypothetical protein D6679_13470 [Candidatus Hydrogenedentota bacterium]|nr:MAG: hypothetical protein D6679_13470 [Candidatus Hydrogenedentota bacterium]
MNGNSTNQKDRTGSEAGTVQGTDPQSRRLRRRLLLAFIFALVLLVAIMLIKMQFLSPGLSMRDAWEAEWAGSRTVQEFSEAYRQLPLYELRIAPEYWRRIEAFGRRKLAANEYLMRNEEKVWYPAKFLFDGKLYRCDVRLHGDVANHWAFTKKSWAVRFKKDRPFPAVKRMNLVLPSDKEWEGEIVLSKVGREMGVLTYPMRFVRLRINGVDYGVMIRSDRLNDKVLELARHPPGVIFKVDNLWTLTHFTGFGMYQYANYVPELPLRLPLYESAYTTDDAGESRPREATARWNAFLRLVREASDEEFEKQIPLYLDIEKFLRWNALTWLFGSYHSHEPDNLRWYFNSATGLFEPILYDVDSKEIDNLFSGSFEIKEFEPVSLRLMRITEYRERRNAILWRLVNDPHFDIVARRKEIYNRLRTAFLSGAGAPRWSFMKAEHDSAFRILNTNRKRLRGHLAYSALFVSPTISSAPSSAEKETPTLLTFEALIDGLSPVRIDSITLTIAPESILPDTGDLSLASGTGRETTSIPFRTRITQRRIDFLPENLILHARVLKDLRPAPNARRILLVLPPGLRLPTPESLDGRPMISVAATNFLTKRPLSNGHVFVSPPAIPDPDYAPPVPLDRLLPLRSDTGSLILPRGDYSVTRNAYLPPGPRLVIEAGTRLRLGPDINLVSYAPVSVLGTKEHPVHFEPLVPNRPWGSFVIVDAPETNVFRYAVFSNGGGRGENYVNGLRSTAMLFSAQSDLTMDHCRIEGAVSDDGLNVKNAAAKITGTQFSNNASDGFDGDWVRTAVTDCRFDGNGGDALDLAGSNALVRSSVFASSGDKGISAGESSIVSITECTFRDNAIGIASKDRSRVTAEQSRFLANGTALAAYQKKKIFGPGWMETRSCVFEENGKDADAKPGSTIQILP